MHAAAPTGRDGRPPATTPMRQGHIRKEREEGRRQERNERSGAACPVWRDATPIGEQGDESQEQRSIGSPGWPGPIDCSLSLSFSLSFVVHILKLLLFHGLWAYVRLRPMLQQHSHAQRRTSGACKGWAHSREWIQWPLQQRGNPTTAGFFSVPLQTLR